MKPAPPVSGFEDVPSSIPVAGQRRSFLSYRQPIDDRSLSFGISSITSWFSEAADELGYPGLGQTRGADGPRWELAAWMREMPLQSQLRNRLEYVLSTVDDQSYLGPRLNGDAMRLWDRIRKFASMNLIGPDIDIDALELSSYALQLPPRQGRGVIAGKLGRTNLRDRCEQAAELLVSLLGVDVEESLLDRTTRLLHEVPHRAPVIDEAKLLADVLNLDDFGATGLIVQTVQLGLQGQGVADLLLGAEKREQYNYWEARLKDGFHFEAVRLIAVKRLENARRLVKMLEDEVRSDRL